MHHGVRSYIWCYFSITTYLVEYTEAVPADYCNFPLNRSDCGVPPTSVFSYWKPGSRCELQIWRGCPSYNRFDNEMTCSHFCIGRTKLEEIDSDENKIDSNNDEPCGGQLNTDDCGGRSTKVYTYDHDKKACVKAIWKGCATKNMFTNQAECADVCKKYDITELVKKAKYLTPDDFQQVNDILDRILNGKKGNEDNANKENEGGDGKEDNESNDDEFCDTLAEDTEFTTAILPSSEGSTNTPEGGDNNEFKTTNKAEHTSAPPTIRRPTPFGGKLKEKKNKCRKRKSTTKS